MAVNPMSNEPEVRCVLCGSAVQAPDDQPLLDSPEQLFCRRHDRESLARAGLDSANGVVLSKRDFGTVVGAWDQWEGALGIYILFADGHLLIISTAVMSDVAVALVAPEHRALVEPMGVPRSKTAPWPEAIDQRWKVHSISSTSSAPGTRDARLRMRIGAGELTVGTYPATWREMGEYRHFLSSSWEPAV